MEQRRCGAPRWSTCAVGAARGPVEWSCGSAILPEPHFVHTRRRSDRVVVSLCTAAKDRPR